MLPNTASVLVYQFISINLVTFLAYWVDKRAAVRGAWRIPERNLHTLEMLGGWSGALAGQKILHHKNKKKSYRAEFAFVLIMQLGFIAVALHFSGTFITAAGGNIQTGSDNYRKNND